MRKVDEAWGEEEGKDLRLIRTPTFFKLCEARSSSPARTDLVPGMYLSRAQFELAMTLKSARGKKGGIRVGYGTVPRYINNTHFTGLLRDGWIGSSDVGVSQVGEQSRMSLERDRSLVLAIKRDPSP